MFKYIKKKKLIEQFANHIANLEKLADKYYYVYNDKSMSDFILNKVDSITEMTKILKIWSETYKRAIEIYNFSKSGKKDYVLNEKQLNELKLFNYWRGLI